MAIPYYNITPAGNFEGKNIFNITRGPETVAKEVGMQEADFKAELKIARDKLLTVRSQRIRPLLDDKILTSWNALMISAMAKTGRVLDDTDRIQKSARAMEFLLSQLRTPEGKILRRYRDGEARYDGYLYDYTATATACLDLYEATYEPH